MMGFFCCFKANAENKDGLKKNNVGVAREGNTNLANLVDNISLESNSNKHRTVAEEILKIGNGNTYEVRVFKYAELVAATENFKEEKLIGEGGFGRVYKGYLEDTKQDIAVKQLDRNGLQGNREFLVEVLMLNLLHHEYLVNLIGYCADEGQKLLVYDYMKNGSLEDHLLDLPSNKKPLDWDTRMKIAVGAAKGLEYLHDVAKPPVIYRDFKASNILLDENFNSRLSDFGMARVGPSGDKCHVSTRVMGTFGYCAPEYVLTGKLTTMSDVYSFGVVFLEMITGRRVVDTERPSSEQHLVNWAEPRFRDKRRFIEMADPVLEGDFPTKGLYQALAVAAMCIQEDASKRPLISDVVTALEYLSKTKKDPKQPCPASKTVTNDDLDNAEEDTPNNEEEGDDGDDTQREIPNKEESNDSDNVKEEETSNKEEEETSNKEEEGALHSQDESCSPSKRKTET